MTAERIDCFVKPLAHLSNRRILAQLRCDYNRFLSTLNALSNSRLAVGSASNFGELFERIKNLCIRWLLGLLAVNRFIPRDENIVEVRLAFGKHCRLLHRTLVSGFGLLACCLIQRHVFRTRLEVNQLLDALLPLLRLHPSATVIGGLIQDSLCVALADATRNNRGQIVVDDGVFNVAEHLASIGITTIEGKRLHALKFSNSLRSQQCRVLVPCLVFCGDLVDDTANRVVVDNKAR